MTIQKANWQSILHNDKETINETKFTDDFQTVFQKLISRFSDDEIVGRYYSELNEFTLEIECEFPSLLNSLNFKIQPFTEYRHSCIITDEEVDEMARSLHHIWLEEMNVKGFESAEQLDGDTIVNPDFVHFDGINDIRKRFYREIVCCIPIALKELKYEVVKPMEIEFFKPKLVIQIAQALHERYRYIMNNETMQYETKKAYETTYLFNSSYVDLEFDQLDEVIKNSNIDCAYHISTKLISIGYYLEKAEPHEEPSLLILDETDIETMSKLEHERWCWEKRLNGYMYGEIKTDKTHYCLVPYNELPEFEKTKDRDQVEQYPIIIKDLGFCVKALDTEKSQHVSYIRQKPSHIEKSMLIIDKQLLHLNQIIENQIPVNELKESLISTKEQLQIALNGLNHVRKGIRSANEFNKIS